MKRIDLKLSGNDHLAIIAALGVVTDLGLEESDEQAVLNASLASSASKKLSSGSGSFSPNEARMVLAAVSFARLILRVANSFILAAITTMTDVRTISRTAWRTALRVSITRTTALTHISLPETVLNALLTHAEQETALIVRYSSSMTTRIWRS